MQSNPISASFAASNQPGSWALAAGSIQASRSPIAVFSASRGASRSSRSVRFRTASGSPPRLMPALPSANTFDTITTTLATHSPLRDMSHLLQAEAEPPENDHRADGEAAEQEEEQVAGYQLPPPVEALRVDEYHQEAAGRVHHVGPPAADAVPDGDHRQPEAGDVVDLSLIHISEPTRLGMISYAVFCLKK